MAQTEFYIGECKKCNAILAAMVVINNTDYNEIKAFKVDCIMHSLKIRHMFVNTEVFGIKIGKCMCD